MLEFFNEIINPVNLMATSFMGLVLFYWLLVIFGAIGMDAIDVDLDMDLDGDLEIDVGADGVLEAVFGPFLIFFHVGKSL